MPFRPSEDGARPRIMQARLALTDLEFLVCFAAFHSQKIGGTEDKTTNGDLQSSGLTSIIIPCFLKRRGGSAGNATADGRVWLRYGCWWASTGINSHGGSEIRDCTGAHHCSWPIDDRSQRLQSLISMCHL